MAGEPVYVLGSDPAERDRLRRQSGELRAYSEYVLDRVGAAPGWSALDAGCGPSGVLELLATRLQPGGRVTGIDVDLDSVRLARAHVRDLGLANVTVQAADARHTGLPPESFDLVHARTLLINIPDAAEVVAQMARLVRPGGWVALIEPDGVLSMCHPSHPAWDRMIEMFRQVHDAHGTDPLIGRRLPELLRHAGLTQIGTEARVDVFPPGHPRRTIRLDLVTSMRPKILELGIATVKEIDEVSAAVRQHLDDPRTLVLSQLFILAWGRKPD